MNVLVEQQYYYALPTGGAQDSASPRLRWFDATVTHFFPLTHGGVYRDTNMMPQTSDRVIDDPTDCECTRVLLVVILAQTDHTTTNDGDGKCGGVRIVRP